MDSFIAEIFNDSPQPPFTYHIELDSEHDLVAVLSNILVSGARARYNKALDSLDEREIIVMRQYLQSFGWDADYASQAIAKEVLDYHKDGNPYIRLIEINRWNITFKAAEHVVTPHCLNVFQG